MGGFGLANLGLITSQGINALNGTLNLTSNQSYWNESFWDESYWNESATTPDQTYWE